MHESCPGTKVTTFDHESLLAEQSIDQQGKDRTRMLAEYNGIIFPGQEWLPPRAGPVTDFLRPFNVGEKVSLQGILQGMANLSGRQVHWAEMGGGYGLAMRETALLPDMKSKVKMTNVDLFQPDFSDLPTLNVNFLQTNYPGLIDANNEPEFFQGNMETIHLPQPADLITSVETVQYLNDPLAAICNWYNQLADYGVLIVSAERDWPAWIRYTGSFTSAADTPSAHLLDELARNNIKHAIAEREDYESGHRPSVGLDSFHTIVVQKRPATALICNSKTTKIWKNPSDFKVTYYPRPETNQLFELVHI